MEVCRGHGEEELLITGAEDGAEEKSARAAYLKFQNVTKSSSFFIDSISVKINCVIWSCTHSKS